MRPGGLSRRSAQPISERLGGFVLELVVFQVRDEPPKLDCPVAGRNQARHWARPVVWDGPREVVRASEAFVLGKALV